MKIQELSRGQFLYKKGDPSPHFYFILKGKLELVVESPLAAGDSSQNEFKFSKNVDEYEFFG